MPKEIAVAQVSEALEAAEAIAGLVQARDHDRMTVEIDRDELIAREPAVVFDYLADVGNYPRWQQAIQEAAQVTPGPPGPGTQLRFLLRGPTGPIELLAEIDAFDRPAALAIHSLTGPAAIEARCTLDVAGADGSGTCLHLTGSITLKGFLRFAEGRARKVIDKELPVALADLARRIEFGSLT